MVGKRVVEMVVEDEVVDEEIELEGPGSGQAKSSKPITKPVSRAELEVSVGRKPVDVRLSPLIDLARIPYSAHLKQQKYTWEYGHFLQLYKHLKINLPFMEVLCICPNMLRF